jgi:hypothetical protein
MVIYNFNIFRAIYPGGPLEANAPLLVDTDAVLTFPVTGKSLQMVTGKLCQIPQGRRRFKDSQPLFGLMTETLKSPHSLPLGQAPGVLVFVAPNHRPVYQ